MPRSAEIKPFDISISVDNAMIKDIAPLFFLLMIRCNDISSRFTGIIQCTFIKEYIPGSINIIDSTFDKTFVQEMTSPRFIRSKVSILIASQLTSIQDSPVTISTQSKGLRSVLRSYSVFVFKRNARRIKIISGDIYGSPVSWRIDRLAQIIIPADSVVRNNNTLRILPDQMNIRFCNFKMALIFSRFNINQPRRCTVGRCGIDCFFYRRIIT